MRSGSAQALLEVVLSGPPLEMSLLGAANREYEKLHFPGTGELAVTFVELWVSAAIVKVESVVVRRNDQNRIGAVKQELD